MKTGTKSVLFGVHQFLWHPITVWMGWVALYGKRPTFKQCIAIAFHDSLGYIGSDRMDDEYGEEHPIRSANMLLRFGELIGCPEFFREPADEILRHSRYLCARLGIKPSKLCWSDKMSLAFDPKWAYLLRGRLSGELYEYKQNAISSGALPANVSNSEWFDWVRQKCVMVAIRQTPAQVRNRGE